MHSPDGSGTPQMAREIDARLTDFTFKLQNTFGELEGANDRIRTLCMLPAPCRPKPSTRLLDAFADRSGRRQPAWRAGPLRRGARSGPAACRGASRCGPPVCRPDTALVLRARRGGRPEWRQGPAPWTSWQPTRCRSALESSAALRNSVLADGASSHVERYTLAELIALAARRDNVMSGSISPWPVIRIGHGTTPCGRCSIFYAPVGTASPLTASLVP